jgi:Bacterial dnaA protein helix-turn-helix
MLKDHQVFTDARDMVAHYKRVRENLHKNVYVPEPRSEVEDPPPKKKVLEVEERPKISIDPKYIEEYERSIQGLREAGRKGKANHVTMRDIVNEVAKKHNFTAEDLLVPSRRKKFVAARHEAFYRMRHELKLPYPRIAMFFDMDHSTVIHGIKKHAKSLEKEKANG